MMQKAKIGWLRSATVAASGICMAVVCITLFVGFGSNDDEAVELELSSAALTHMQRISPAARFQQLAYTFKPEDNPLADFDSAFKAKKYSYEEDENPFQNFKGYGFSSQTHKKGVSPYPPTTKEDALNVFEALPAAKYPFDERKDGLKEIMHQWQHFDWKKSPSDAIKEVNVWDDKGSDSAWQLGDKMSFKWHHWEDKTLDQDSPTKAIKDINVWDNSKLFPVSGYKWSATAASVVQDNNEPDQPGTEKNILMSFKYPNY